MKDKQIIGKKFYASMHRGGDISTVMQAIENLKQEEVYYELVVVRIIKTNPIQLSEIEN